MKIFASATLLGVLCCTPATLAKKVPNSNWDQEFGEKGSTPICFIVNGNGGSTGIAGGILPFTGSHGDVCPRVQAWCEDRGIPVYNCDWSDVHKLPVAKTLNLSDDNFRQQMKGILSYIDPNRPIILVGHSFGGDSVLKLSQDIAPRQVLFLGLFDPVKFGGLREDRNVPNNVKYFFNMWTEHPDKSAGVPVPVNFPKPGNLIVSAPTLDRQDSQSIARKWGSSYEEKRKKNLFGNSIPVEIDHSDLPFDDGGQFKCAEWLDIALKTVNFVPKPPPTNRLQWGQMGDKPITADFDGDGTRDLVVWRNGSWFIKASRSAFREPLEVPVWGTSGDFALGGDLDGDLKSDLVVWRPSTGSWFLKTSSSSFKQVPIPQWGQSGDIPLLSDFDGDGRADLVVWRPSSGDWFVRTSSNGWQPMQLPQWGTKGDIPLICDFDGDGKPDLTVWRPSTGEWFVKSSANGWNQLKLPFWGTAGDVPLSGDFDRDGKSDLIVWRPITGEWFLKTSSTGWKQVQLPKWGVQGDIPLSGDYDGDGKLDLSIWRPSNGVWYFKSSSSNFQSEL